MFCDYLNEISFIRKILKILLECMVFFFWLYKRNGNFIWVNEKINKDDLKFKKDFSVWFYFDKINFYF